MSKYEYTQPIRSGKPDNYVLSIYIDGKQHKKRISKKYDTEGQKKLAQDLMDEWIQMLETDLNPFVAEDVLLFNNKIINPTVEYTVKEYLATQRNANEKTVGSYKTKLAMLQPLNNLKVSDIKASHINDILFKKVSSGEYAQSTLTHAKSVLTGYFNWLIEKEYLVKAPLKFPKALKSTKDVDDGAEAFNDVHFKKIIEELRKPKHKLLYHYILFIYHLHLRPNEVRQIKKSDIDINNKIITVRASVSKVGKKADVDLNSQMVDIIVNQLGYNKLKDDDYILALTTKSGKRKQISSSYVSDRFRENILKPLNLYDGTGYKLYSFKSKGNIDKLNAGWLPAQLMKLNRHANIETTLIYLKKITKVTDIQNLPEVFI